MDGSLRPSAAAVHSLPSSAGVLSSQRKGELGSQQMRQAQNLLPHLMGLGLCSGVLTKLRAKGRGSSSGNQLLHSNTGSFRGVSRTEQSSVMQINDALLSATFILSKAILTHVN